jgi:hypothetical protein
MSMTSLSICTRRDTVNSKSALDGQFHQWPACTHIGLTRSGVDSRHVHMPVPIDIEQRQQRGYDTKTDTMTKTTSVHPSDISNMPHEQAGLTFVSRFFNLLLKSANSGEVIKIIFNLITIILANSRSYSSVSTPIPFEMNLHHLSPRSLRLS